MANSYRMSWNIVLIVLLIGFAVIATKQSTGSDENKSEVKDENPDKPLVRCIIVSPPNSKPHKDVQERLTLVMKDLQWWYACQMAAYGYGMKTFSLETDDNGKVIVHQAQLDEIPDTDHDAIMNQCVHKAEETFGTFGERKGTVMLVLYGDYIWGDKKEYKSIAQGRGCDRRWTFLTSWHYFNVNPRGWQIKTRSKDFNDPKHFLGPVHAKVIAAGYPDKSIGEVLSGGHGGFAHELGHAFGLHHPAKDGDHIKGDVMSADLWYMRGCFSPKFPQEYCVISPKDATILNDNPVFTVQKQLKPVTRSSAKWAVRGVKGKRK